MNVFEDLIDELKEDNLLEDTVLDVAGTRSRAVQPSSSSNGHTNGEMSKAEPEEDGSISLFEPTDSDLTMAHGETVEIRKPTSEQEYFKKRAMDEVSGLQMVEHILTGVEREQAKIAPKAFDDFNVKLALNSFLQVSDDASSDDHKQAEFALMQETEAWCSALAVRDEKLLVVHVRRFCENARPMLSSRAMISAAKFYRNLPYSEQVRAKFDFLITRLFSRPSPDHSRTLLFVDSEVQSHIRTLYADWASLSIHNSADDVEHAQLARVSFAEFIREAESAQQFATLVESDLFNRIRVFKQSLAEMFFVPEVLAAAIDCNVRVGNVYLRLVNGERARFEAELEDAEEVVSDDHAASIATGRSLELADIFRDAAGEAESLPFFSSEAQAAERQAASVAQPIVEKSARSTVSVGSRIESVSRAFAGLNRWLLLTSVALIVISIGMWTWATYFVDSVERGAGVKAYDVSNSAVKTEIKAGRIVGDTFHGMTLPGWSTMTDEKKKEVLQKLLRDGPAQGWNDVVLMDSAGKTVAYASAESMELSQ